jgi:hypothetical protein
LLLPLLRHLLLHECLIQGCCPLHPNGVQLLQAQQAGQHPRGTQHTRQHPAQQQLLLEQAAGATPERLLLLLLVVVVVVVVLLLLLVLRVLLLLDMAAGGGCSYTR